MIRIVFGDPRKGKTCYMTYKAYGYAYDHARNYAMQTEIAKMQASGFTSIKTVPTHCISSNYDMIFNKLGCSTVKSRRINPYRLGFKNEYVDTHFNFPYEVIVIQEMQKYLNSRRSSMFPDWQSRWYEQHGHNRLDIWGDTQRPQLIDVNVRALAEFIEIVKLDILRYDVFGQPAALRWTLRHIEDNFALERYFESGKRDKRYYTEFTEVADFNVFGCYDSFSCKPKFFDGHMDSDFDYAEAKPTVQSYNGYIEWLEAHDDELPQGFYQKIKAA